MDNYLAFISMFWAFAFGIAVGWGVTKITTLASILREIKKDKP